MQKTETKAQTAGESSETYESKHEQVITSNQKKKKKKITSMVCKVEIGGKMGKNKTQISRPPNVGRRQADDEQCRGGERTRAEGRRRLREGREGESNRAFGRGATPSF